MPGVIGDGLIGDGLIGTRIGAGLSGVGRPDIAIIVEFAYGAAPDAANPTWTDETTRLLLDPGFSISRGVTNERGNLQAGTLTFTLKNPDRRFDPTYTSGPLYGLLRPRTPVRVRLGVGGAFKVAWRGVVEGGWPQNYTSAYSTVEINAVDAFGFLSQQDGLPETFFDAAVTADSPSAWWRFDDTGIDVVDTIAGIAAGAQGAPVRVDPLVKGRGGALKCGPVEYFSTGTPALAPLLGTNAGSVEVVFATTAPGPIVKETRLDGTVGFVLSVLTAFGGDYIFIVSTDGTTQSSYSGSPGAGFAASKIKLTDGATHHIIVRSAGSGSAWDIYVDGRRYGSGSPTTVTVASSTVARWATGAGITLSDIAYYPTALTPSRIILHAQAVHSAREFESVGDRLGFVCDTAGWTLHDRPHGVFRTTTSSAALDDNGQTLGSGYKGGNALQLLQQLQDTEQGRIYVASDGTITMKPRSWAWGVTQTAAFDDAGTGLAYSAGGTTFVLDDRDLVNAADVTRESGTTQTVTDATSITANGRRSASLSGMWVTDAQARSVAEWLVLSQKNAVPRVDQIAVQPAHTAAALWPFIRDLELGQLLAVSRQVTNNGTAVGSPVTISAHTIGFTHTYSGSDSWRTVLQLDGTRVGWSFFTWGTSTWGGSDHWSF